MITHKTNPPRTIPLTWHRRQRGGGPKCLICCCPGSHTGEHRKIPESEHASHFWEKRKKTQTGWQYFPIGDRREMKIQEAKEELRRQRAKRTGKRVRHADLVTFFYDKFFPKKLRERSPWTAEQYKRTVAKFVQFAGSDVVPVASITERMTEQFREWMLTCGVGLETSRIYFGYLRAIVRAHRPKAFPLRFNGRIQNQAPTSDAAFDVPGSLFSFAKESYFPEKMIGAKESSRCHLLCSIRNLCRIEGRNIAVSELSDELVSDFMSRLLEAGLARPTINNNRADLLCVWRHAYKKKLNPIWPTVGKLQVFRRLPTAWTMGEMDAILAAAAATHGSIGPYPAGAYWTALVLLLFDTGLRLRAALSIERGNVDLSTGWLSVLAETQKQKVEEKHRVTMQTTDALRAIWLPPRGLLFPWPFEKKQVWPKLREILHCAGLPTTRRDLFHKFRRTTASHIAAKAGIDAAARQLGHCSTDMTVRYIDPTIARAHVDGAAYLPRPAMPRLLPGGNSLSGGQLCLPAATPSETFEGA